MPTKSTHIHNTNIVGNTTGEYSKFEVGCWEEAGGAYEEVCICVYICLFESLFYNNVSGMICGSGMTYTGEL